MSRHSLQSIALSLAAVGVVLAVHTAARDRGWYPLDQSAPAACNDKVPMCDEVHETGEGEGPNCECFQCIIHQKGKPDLVTTVCTADPKAKADLRSKIRRP
jgi:hypothetical protein